MSNLKTTIGILGWMLGVVGVLTFPLVLFTTLHYHLPTNRMGWNFVQAEASATERPHVSSYPLISNSWKEAWSPTQKVSDSPNTIVRNRGQESREDEVYLVLDLSVNLLYVRQGEETLYTALASTGSGRMLRDPRHPTKQWKFVTPRGNFKIMNKFVDPVWVKPDWAYIEKKQPIPREKKSRIRHGALGKYALGFGNGYYIHGSINTLWLGFNTTHGCIVINEKDLNYIFQTVPLGATLIIV